MSQKTWLDGEVVTFEIPGVVRGTAKVRGIASNDVAVVGKTLILEVTDGPVPNAAYPFTCIACQELFVKKA